MQEAMLKALKEGQQKHEPTEEEKKKEDALFAELEKLKMETDKAVEADPVKKAKAMAELEKRKQSAIDIEKLIRKE